MAVGRHAITLASGRLNLSMYLFECNDGCPPHGRQRPTVDGTAVARRDWQHGKLRELSLGCRYPPEEDANYFGFAVRTPTSRFSSPDQLDPPKEHLGPGRSSRLISGFALRWAETAALGAARPARHITPTPGRNLRLGYSDSSDSAGLPFLGKAGMPVAVHRVQRRMIFPQRSLTISAPARV